MHVICVSELAGGVVITWKARVCMWSRENCRWLWAVKWRSSLNVERASSSTDARLGAESSSTVSGPLSTVLCQFTSWRRSAGSSCSLSPSESEYWTTCSMMSRSVIWSANVESSTWMRIDGWAALSICERRVSGVGPAAVNNSIIMHLLTSMVLLLTVWLFECHK